MKIIVLAKQVPDTTDVKIDPRKGTLIREGVDAVVNPEDLVAVEAALRFRDDHGGTVTAVSMGPPQAREALFEILAMGADDAVLLTDRAFAGADTLATAYTLARCIETLGDFDLILCGRQAIDGDTAQIGPEVAEILGVPQVTYVQGLEVVEGGIRAQRALEDGFETIETPLPALLTAVGDLASPRLPTVEGIIDACDPGERLRVWNAADIRCTADRIGQHGSRTWVVKTEAPRQTRLGERLEGSPEEQASGLLEALKKKNLIP